MADRTERQLREELSEIADDRDGTDGYDVEPEELTAEFREADPEARPNGMEWDPETGTVYYDVWSAQREALDALGDDHDHDLLGFLAGYGSGKSVFGARWLIAQALEYPGSHFLVMGTTFSEARSSTFPKLFAQLPGENTALRTTSFNGPEQSPLVVDYNRQENRLTLVNDSIITLGSADKWSRFAGVEVGGTWLDEPSHYGSDLHDLLEMMGSRLRGVAGPKKQLWTLTGNGYNAAWEILEKRQDSNGEPLGLDIELIRASTLDNPYLSDGEKDRFRRQYADTGREEQALHGGFAAAQGLVYSRFSRDQHVIPDEDARERAVDEWRIFGYDAGWSDPRVLLEIGRTAFGQLVVLDEYHQSETHVEDVIGWLQAHEKPRGTIYAEHNPSDIDRFERAGYPVTKANKDLDEGISEVRRRLKNEVRGTDNSPGANEGVEGLRNALSAGRENGSASSSEEETEQERVGLFVSERCRNLIREFFGYKKEDVGTAAAVDHCLDSLRYAVHTHENGEAGGSSEWPDAIPSTW